MKRDRSPELEAGMAARSLVGGINNRIGILRSRAAALHMMTDRSKRAGGDDPRIAEQAGALASEIEALRVRLETLVSSVEPAIASHRAVLDTRGALEGLRKQVSLLG